MFSHAIKPIFAAFLAVTLLLTASAPKVQSAAASNVLRLHVIANSDSDGDQSTKLAVRDAVIDLERGLFEDSGVTSASEAKAILMNNADALLDAVDSTLAEYGADYSAQLKIGVYAFPNREYAGVTYPADDYEALRIVLGNGEGKNWWCVMFPPLCILEDNTEQKDENKAASDSTANEENASEQASGFKSIFAELFDWVVGLFG